MAEWVTPIVDRTEADTVEAFNNQMIEAHLKGALNYSDLNRIENNYKYLIENLQKNGYYVNHKYRNYTETEPVVTAIEVPGEPGSTSGIVEPYLTSVGSANYVDTGYVPNSNTRAVIDVRLDTAGSGGMYFFGCRESGTSGRFMLFTNNTDIGFGYDANVTLINTITVGKRYTIDFNKNALTFDGQTTSLPASTFKNTRTFYLFNENMAGTLNKGLNFTLYSCQIYDNGTLVRDFVPKLDDNGVACLYDKVESKYYYNKGTGTLTYGEDVYSPVEYIESSTGTQYIDTGIKGKTGISAKGEFSVPNFTSAIPLGCYNPQRCYMLSFDGTYVRYGYVNWHNATKPITANEKHSFEVDFSAGNQFLKIDDEILITSKETTTFANNYNLYAFAYNDSGTAGDYAKIKIYALSLYDNDVLVRDFVPVIDSSGVALLYDKLNGVPYYNAGTGSFAFKRLKGEVEYIESTGTQYINTGVIATYPLEINLKIKTLSNTTSADAFLMASVVNNATVIPVYMYAGKWAMETNGNFVSTSDVTIANNTDYELKVTLENGKQTFVSNGQTLLTTNVSATGNSGALYLFARNMNGTATHLSSMKVKGLSMKQNGVLVRDYVPYIDEAGVACLLDKVSNSYYYNAGSGAFNAGAPVVKAPSEDEPEGDYIIPEIDIDPNIWNVYDIPTDKETSRYINNLLVIRRQIAQNNTLALPTDMEGFNYNDANNIEIMLFVVNNLITQMIAQYRRCNTFKCGERR